MVRTQFKTSSRRTFFASCALGLEPLLLEEIKEVSGFLVSKSGFTEVEGVSDLRLEEGGVSFQANLGAGLQLNYFTRIANRILLRLARFEAREFYEFEIQIKKLPLKEFGLPVRSVQVDSSQSRLGQERRLEGIFRSLVNVDEQVDAGLDVYIRIFRDRVTVSVDTSGEHLHFRGHSKKVGAAPLRETLAAGCLRFLFRDYSRSELQKVCLWDPMLGSGTFLQEAAEFFSVNLSRDFSFEAFKNKPSYLSRNSLGIRSTAGRSLGPLFGSDVDQVVLALARENLGSLGVGVELFHGDFFKTQPEWGRGVRFLVMNAPYGERLTLPKNFQELLMQRISELGLTRAGILVSQSHSQQISSAAHRSLSFRNGGLPVKFLVFEF